MKQILLILIIFIYIFENMATGKDGVGEPSKRKEGYSPNEAESKNREMNPTKNFEVVAPDTYIFNSFDQNRNEKRKGNNSSNSVHHRPVTRSQIAKRESSNFVPKRSMTRSQTAKGGGYNFVELGRSEIQKPKSKKAKTFHQRFPPLEQRMGEQHSAPEIGQGSSVPAGILGPNQQIQWPQQLPKFATNPNFLDPNQESRLFAEAINPFNYEEERKTLKEIEENLVKLYETKEKLKNLKNKIDKHDKVVTENEHNLGEVVIKELEKTKKDFANKKEEVEQQIEEMEKQKEQITQKIQEKAREKLKTGKGNH